MAYFKYNTETAVFFGEKCFEKNINMIKEYGTKAMIITGPILSGRRTGNKHLAVAEVQALLEENGIEYIINDGVIENPPVESVAEMTKQALEYKPDFIISIGGGSAMDTAKGVSYLMKFPEADNPYKVLYAEPGMPLHSLAIKSEGLLPIFAIPTTAGTGAEITPYAILTRTDIDAKLSIYPLIYNEAAFVDYRYVKGSPWFLLHTGAMDAIAHAIEVYVNPKSNYLNRALCEVAMKLFASYKDRLYKEELLDEDYEKMGMTATIAGIALAQASTSLPHGMGYPLSHHKGMNHGLSSSICLGEYIKRFKDQTLVEPVIELCGFADSDEFAEYMTSLAVRNTDIEITMEELNEWTDDFMKQTGRFANHPEKWDRDDIWTVYYNSLKTYIKE